MKIEQLLVLLKDWNMKNSNTLQLASINIFSDGSGHIINDDDTLTEFESVDELIEILRS